MSEKLLTKEELREKLNVPSVRVIEEMVKAKRLPVIRLGYRTVRFDWSKVQAALARLTVKAVG